MQRGFDYKQYAILYVDDEQQALKYFDRAMAKDFDVLTATSAAEGWQIIRDDPERIGVVITDQRMPQETGVDLLEKVRKAHPRIVRILTTAYADLDSAIEAVNSGAIYQYVTKPWVMRDLRGLLLRAMEFCLLQRDRDRLLSQKLSALQRVFLLDRVRSLAVLGASLGGRLHRSLNAIRAYCQDATRHGPITLDATDNAERVDLWELTTSETRQLIDVVKRVVGNLAGALEAVAEPIDVGQALKDATSEGASETSIRVAAIEVAEDLPALRGDPMLYRAMIRGVCDQLQQACGRQASIAVEASGEQNGSSGAALGLSFSVDGIDSVQQAKAGCYSVLRPGSDAASAGLLIAYLVAHHYGGRVTLRDDPRGTTVLVMIPVEPEGVDDVAPVEQWLDDVLSNLSSVIDS